MLNSIIEFFLRNRLITMLLLIILVVWGLVTAPFNYNTGIPGDPVPVDAIPDIGENQQIIFTTWPGRSPQDIEDQITYPLTTYLLGIPGVKTVRSSSIFGFSSIYLIFRDDAEFYWSRSRVLERLASLPAGLLPEGTQPTLGPDATALGQVFWYTLEGRDPTGKVTGGWDLDEIRSVQDFYLKYALSSAEGVSEVASIGGFVREYQVDLDPDAMRIYSVSLEQVMKAVSGANQDVGAKTLEINQVEYLVRGLGYIRNLDDLELAVVSSREGTPVYLRDVAKVSLGPANRRGVLDKEGAEVVGGVVVARYGANPMAVIDNLKTRISESASGMPEKVLPDGTISKLTVVPFYDRSGLIRETLGTLEEALTLEILITVLVVIVMVINLRASFLISGLLPVAILMVFIAMRYFGVDANIVALSGIAIAIGTMVDLGVILSENVIKHMELQERQGDLTETILKAVKEVSAPILTAVMTTVVSFIPVFTLEAAEGKLFRPLAFTKTFALVAALIVTLVILPTVARIVFGWKIDRQKAGGIIHALFILSGSVLLFILPAWLGVALIGFGASFFVKRYWVHPLSSYLSPLVAILVAGWLLSEYWLPLGPSRSTFTNFSFVAILVGSILLVFRLLERYYENILRWCLGHKLLFLSVPAVLIVFALIIWLGAAPTIGKVIPGSTALENSLESKFPGIGEEFMPALDEGSFLLMPSSMPHSGVEFNRRVLGQLDMLVRTIPEVDMTVGKMGRVESALDPAPISMFENVINYKPEYILDQDGRRMRFRVDNEGNYLLTDGEYISHEAALLGGMDREKLVTDPRGQYFRNWRSHIHSPDDIWNEIVAVTNIPGVTSSPKLQPIETRLVMLQTGMRAPMGVKVYGPDLQSIEGFATDLESLLKKVPSVEEAAVFADRIVGKPYLNLRIDRNQIARYGLSVEDIQRNIMAAVGGMPLSETVEGRERYTIRVRYPRELRDSPEAIGKILVRTSSGIQIPLSELVTIEYVRGPQMIKSENTFLVGYVIFDKREEHSEVDVVNEASDAISAAIARGEIQVPEGVTYKFAGSYENQVRAEKRLTIIIPMVLALVFIILYLQFRSAGTSFMIFTGIALAFSGGFIFLWLYGQEWFANFSLFGTNLRDMFGMGTVNLSVAVWVGFIALFGIATDDGVLIATYLDQRFRELKPGSLEEVRSAVIEAGKRRIRPALMTVATTMIALLPVLSSTGKGSDIMVPMAIPSFGGMAVALISVFLVPTLFAMRAEFHIKRLRS